MGLVELDHISKTFGRRRSPFGRPSTQVEALRDVSLHLDAGETLGLVGESGSGKSTLGRIALRLIDPDAGHVRIEDRSLAELSRSELRSARRRMQMIFQDPFGSLNPRMVIEDQIAEPMLIHGIGTSQADRRKKIESLIERVGLTKAYLPRFPYEFSGGQLQRVAIARALATDPVFIVCDEPVAALDVSIRAQVLNLLKDLQDERGLAYLFISHDLSIVRIVAHRIAVMERGVVVETGTTEEIFTNPRHPYTRELLNAVPGRDPDHRTLLKGSRPKAAEASNRR